MFRKKNNIIIKTEEQIEGISLACKLAAETLKYLGQFAVEGNTTKLIDKKCEEFMRDHGAISATKGYMGYPAHCCVSVNDVVCHGIPGAYVLKNGDIVNIDVTPILHGFFGDTSRMFEIGEVSSVAGKLVEVTRKCLWEGIHQVAPGKKFGDIGHAITQLAKKHHYSVVYQFAGHGVGVNFHEEPQIDHNANKDSGPTMLPGMTFTIEPMINQGKARCVVDKRDHWTARTIDGKLSAQFEHTILVTENGFRVLTDIFHDF